MLAILERDDFHSMRLQPVLRALDILHHHGGNCKLDFFSVTVDLFLRAGGLLDPKYTNL